MILAATRRAVARRALSSARAAPLVATATQRGVVADELLDANGGLQEFSVVYTDRALNHMSSPFQSVMKDLHATLTTAYNTDHAVLIPGSGTYGMEAAARAFAGSDRKVVVIRNGYFSFRWSQIFDELGNKHVTVINARPLGAASAAASAAPGPCVCNPGQLCGGWDKGSEPCIAPPPIEEVEAIIARERPALVCAPHVETSAGIILPEDYITRVAAAAHAVGATFVLDGIASGAAWVDMGKTGVDVFLTAPQKGWTGPAAAGIVMLSEQTRAKLAAEAAAGRLCGSFCVNLLKWHGVMKTYLDGAHSYYTTMPTDALRAFRDVAKETEAVGLQNVQSECFRLGKGVRRILLERGFRSVAAKGFEAPGLVVVYAPDATFAAKFKERSQFQIAAGVPLVIGEPSSFTTFRIGLFGLDKWTHVDRTLASFEKGLDAVLAK
ncbi:pyridoxal phosphate-dependent transferase [Pavlovales sp. CCMP2436]|nr:pyridoxal phosphate-dependent transferase [Pavlovales sp. CCMP2436]